MTPQQLMMQQQQAMMRATAQAQQAQQAAAAQQHQQQQQQHMAYARHLEQQAAVATMERQRHLEYLERQRAREARQQQQHQQQQKGTSMGQQQQKGMAQQQRQQPQPPVAFLKKDFPTLGDEEEEGKSNEPLIAAPPTEILQRPVPPAQSQAPPAAMQMQAAQGPGPAARLLFCNPTPAAPPINANNVRSYFMTPRDLCYVVHSMMRPLASLDAYNDDYYRWGYDDRRSRNLLMLGDNPNNQNLPQPVWKETKERAQAIETKYRGNVEKRAEKFAEKQQTLGRTVKVNVRRPKALLATTGALTTAAVNAATNSGTADEEQREERSEEDRQRVHLWSARMAIDGGYVAYLDLLETRRLLQTNPNGVLEAEEEAAGVAERRADLTRDVEANVAKLHASLGVTVSLAVAANAEGDPNANAKIIDVDAAALSRTLGLPKGRMLLSRVLDDGILPHSSACRVLPKALGAVLSTAVPAAGAPPRGEDRLVRSLAGLVQTAQPSLAPDDLVACLDEFGAVYQSELADRGPSPGDTVRAMLGASGGQRARMELLHAILSRGGAVCGGAGPDVAAAWKAKEAEFMSILSAMNA